MIFSKLPITKFIFKWRGLIVALAALAVLFFAAPTLKSLLFGICLTLAGELIRLWAIGYTGEPTRGQELSAPKLVTSGPYSLSRNPLYIGNALNALGVAFCCAGNLNFLPSLITILGTAVVLHIVYWSCITVEEAFLNELFGQEYRIYCSKVPRFLTFPTKIFSAYNNKKDHFSFGCWKYETSTLIWLVIIWLYLSVSCFFSF